MQLTSNDLIFLQELRGVSQFNREATGDTKKQALVVPRGLISKELLKLFEADEMHQGAWFFNVYVEFKPMAEAIEAKSWQQ